MSVATIVMNDQEILAPRRLDIWTSIQSQKNKPKDVVVTEPYVHPLMRRSSSLMSQKSLEICTESLGSETGSEDYSSSEDVVDTLLSSASTKKQEKYAVGKRSPTRSFPPPLPSIAGGDGSRFQMRPRRQQGRLLLEAVPVPVATHNHLHAQRHNGRLLLSFASNNTAVSEPVSDSEEEVEEEEEEEVEVVDRGTVIEVKVSTQPQQHGVNSANKVHRSSIVINKFVSCTPLDDSDKENKNENTTNNKQNFRGATTAAAAAVAASSLGACEEEGEEVSVADGKVLVTSTSKRRNREELVHDMRRCSQLKKPLFIWEPCCIATSS